MGCAISCCAEGGPAWLSFVHGFTFVWRTSVLGGHASSFQRDNVALLRGRSNGCEKRLVSGNWRRKTERTTLDRNYVLRILLEQGQRCSSNMRASPSTSLLNTFHSSVVPSCGSRTSPVILADHRISAADAYEWRLVEEVAESGKAFDAAMALAAKVAAQPPLSGRHDQADGQSPGACAR